MMSICHAVDMVKQQRQDYLTVRSIFLQEFPTVMKGLRLIETEAEKKPLKKGFNLVKRESRKYGFLYYVRYFHNGKMLPSKWNTHTNERAEAEDFARKNKEPIVQRYLQLKDTKKHEIYEEFYKENSPYIKNDERWNHPILDKTRANYFNVINKKFIPFLTQKKIAAYDNVSLGILHDFQDELLDGGIKPQSVNDILYAVKRIFGYLKRKRIIEKNPCDELKNVPVHKEDKDIRGCYELDKVHGAFYEEWPDKKSYLLCLLIYSTGMRNSEIARIKKRDIIQIEEQNFIDVKKSKTDSGVRVVPLHAEVKKKLLEYTKELDDGALIFAMVNSSDFKNAHMELARRLGVSREEAKEQNITFYSGRHYWKTMMNSEGLGDSVEELFMGHKVSRDVAKAYNHMDKRGKAALAKKAKQMFEILDHTLFKTKP